MRRLAVLLACAAALAILLLPAAASAAYTTTADCLRCHDAVTGAGAISKVDFGTYVGSGSVDYATCNKCHNVSLTKAIAGFPHNHAITYGPDCAGCHKFVPSYAYTDVTRLQAVNIPGSGYFATWGSLNKTPAELHDIHVNGSWPQYANVAGGICAGCHAPSSCSTCHAGAVAHGTHSATKVSPLTYTTALGQLPTAAVPNTRSETTSCITADCHPLVAAATPAFKPAFCAQACHKPPTDPVDRTLDHGYGAVDHTATVSAVIDPGEVKPCGACHSMDLMTEHARPSTSGPKDCSSCHPNPESSIVGAWNKTCVTYGCHATGTPKAKHANMASAHTTVTISAPIDCYACHKGDLAAIHADSPKSCLACHDTDTVPTTRDCTVCHSSYHAAQDAKHTTLSSGCTGAPGCHPSRKLPENHTLYAGPSSQNPQFADSCALCHTNPAVNTKNGGACESCHDGGPTFPLNFHYKQNHKPADAASSECVKCHQGTAPSNLNWVVQIHNAEGPPTGTGSWDNCATCHNNPTKGNVTAGLATSACANCHKVSGTDFHKSVEASHAAAITPTCVGTCHGTSLTEVHKDATTTVDAAVVSGCFVCHAAGAPDAPIAGKTCETCHFTFANHYDAAKHTSPWAPGDACSGTGCHVSGDANLKSVHDRFRTFDCLGCHGSTVRQDVKDAIALNKTSCDACHAGVNATAGHRPQHYTDPPLAFNGTGGYAYNGGINGEPKTRECATCHRENLIDEHLGTKREDGSWDKFPARDHDGKALTCATCHDPGAPLAARLAILANATNCDACHTIHGTMGQAHTSTYVTSPRVPCAPCHASTIDTLHNNMTSVTSSGTVLTNCAICHSNYDGAYGARVQDAISVTNDTKCTACHDLIHTDAKIVAPHTTTTTTVNALDCKRCHDDDKSVAGVNALPVHAGSNKGACAVCHDNPARVANIAAKTPACVSCHTTSGADFHKSQDASHTFTAMGADCQASGCHSKRLDTEHAKYMTKPAYAGYVDSCALCHQNADPTRIDWKTASADCSSCHATAHPPHIAADYDSCLGSGCHAESADAIVIHQNSDAGACAVCHGSATRPDVTAGKQMVFNCSQSGCHLGFYISSHTRLPAAHQATATASKECAACHQPSATTSVDIDELHRVSGTCALALCHKNPARIGDFSTKKAECASCHSPTGTFAYHKSQDASHTFSTMPADCQASGCHSKVLPTEHDKYMSRYPTYASSCLLCHANKTAGRIPANATADCASCHTTTHPPHNAAASPTCVACHGTGDAFALHVNRPEGKCAVCHANPTKGDLTKGTPTTVSFECAQSGCHTNRSPEDPNHYSDTTHTASPFTPAFQRSTFDAGGKDCTMCHTATLKAAHARTSTNGGSVTCIECHTDTRLNSKAVVAASWSTKTCVACHDYVAPKTHATYATVHVVSAGSCAGTGAGCHDYTDLAKLHDKNQAGGAPKYKSCENAACHDKQDTRPAAMSAANSCGSATSTCHKTVTLANHGTHNLSVTGSNYSNTTVAGCTNSGAGCHGSEARTSPSYENPYHPGNTCGTSPCHTSASMSTHTNPLTCQACHDGTYVKAPNVVTLTALPTAGGHYSETSHTAAAADLTGLATSGGTVSAACTKCHGNTPATGLKQLYAQHQSLPSPYVSTTCFDCHNYNATVAAVVTSKWSGKRCSACHNATAMPTAAQHGTTAPAVTGTSADGCGASGVGCHTTYDLHALHKGSASSGTTLTVGGCAISGCHDYTKQALKPTKKSCGTGGTCHSVPGYHPAHVAKNSATCLASGCHVASPVGDLLPLHAASPLGKCAVCHNNPVGGDRTTGKTTFDCAQSGCHSGVTGDHHTLHDTAGKIDPGCAGCHFKFLDDEHSKLGYTCATCHSSTNAAVVAAIKANDITCGACHPAVNGKNRHAPQYDTEFISGNSSGHNSLGMSYAKTSFKIGTSTYTWSLPTTAWLKTGWTPGSVVSCDDCHTFSGTAAGPHGAAVTVNFDPAYPTNWKSVNLSSNGASSSTFICAKCHQDFKSMNNVHGAGDHEGTGNGTCIRCHAQVPHGWRVPRLLAYTSDPAPYKSLNLTSIRLRNYTPTNWDEVDCGQSGCGEHNATVSPLWPSAVQAPNATLTGTVKASTGAAISGATVAVTGDGSTTSSSTGGYALSLSAGTYTITASATGYASQSKQITLTSGQAATLDFALAATPVSSNIARDKAFTATSEYSSTYSAAKAGDGSASTWWRSRTGLSSSTANQRLTVDLGGSYSINKAVVNWYSSGGTSYHAKDYTVQVSTDNATWTTVATVSNASSGGTRTHSFTTRSARYVRVNATSYNTSNGYGVSEFEVWTP